MTLFHSGFPGHAMFNRTTLVVLLAALAGGLGLLAASRVFDRPEAAGQPALQVVKLFPQPREIPPFSLVQSDGTQLVPGELHGHWTLVFIGFTFCPDVCPTTLAQLARAQKRWESLPESTRPRVLFVSVDPERDTPELAGRYAAHFDPGFLGATAGHEVLEPFARSMGMVYMQSPLEGGGYTVDHSSNIAVLDPQARLVGLMRPPFEAATIAADLRALAGARE